MTANGNSPRGIVDWALIISVIGLFIAILGQQVQSHERLTKIETTVQSETALCDCFGTRSQVNVLEHRVTSLEVQVDINRQRIRDTEN